MKKIVLVCMFGVLALSGFNGVSARNKVLYGSRMEEMREKREKKQQEITDALAKIEANVKNIKDKDTKAALDSVYAYLKMQQNTKMNYRKNRKLGSRTLGRGKARGGRPARPAHGVSAWPRIKNTSP